MRTKWSKGPWKVMDGPPEYIRIEGPRRDDLREIARCHHYNDPQRAEANAQLIASAPDLAERLELTNQQLKHAMDVLQGQHESTWQSLSDCLHANAAALRAARGEK